MIHVLLIGAGTMGRTHALAYSDMDDVRLVGIVDIRKDIQALCSDLKTEHFLSYEEAVGNLQQIDVVDICVPTYLHKNYVLKAAADKKHILCETPLAGNLKDAREMMDVCEHQRVKLYVGQVLRFFPEYSQAKQVIERGDIGKAAVVRTSRVSGFPRGWNDWYADVHKSGGVAVDFGIHDFDFLRWCFGEVERVFAKGLSGKELPKKDYALVTLRFKNGVIAHIEGSWSHSTFEIRLEVAGTEGIIEYNSAKDSPLMLVIEQAQNGHKGIVVLESPLAMNPYFRELKHFIECVKTGNAPLVSSEDAYRALEISIAANMSMHSGHPVTLPLNLE